MMASFMNTESQLAFAHTCKTIYAYHKQKFKEETFTLLCDLRFLIFIVSEYIKTLERCMGQTDWAGVKVTLKIASVDPQNSYEYPIRALFLSGSLQPPNGFDCACLNALIIDFHLEEIYKPHVSLFEKTTNLKSLVLINAIINDDIASMVSKLPLLKFISLNHCTMTKVHPSKIFEGYTILEEIQLLFCTYSDMTHIKLPSQVKRLKMEDDDSFKVDASNCTQLEFL